MKITDPEIIKTGERNLIDSVKDDLDWNVVTEVIKNRMNMKSFESKGGEIVVIDGKIAFRIDLELKMAVSLMFDRDGNYIEGDDISPDLDTSDNSDSLQKVDQSEMINSADRIELSDKTDLSDNADSDQPVDIEKDTQVDQHDLEFGLPDFKPQADDEKSEFTDDDFDIDSEVPDSTVEDIPAEIDMDSGPDFDLGFEEDLDNLGLEDYSNDKSDFGFDEKKDYGRKDDTSDVDIDDDIDDILEETRELWKQKKE